MGDSGHPAIKSGVKRFPCATNALLLAFVVVKVHAVELELYLVQEYLVLVVLVASSVVVA